MNSEPVSARDQLDDSNLPRGFYVVEVVNQEGKRFVEKLILK